jgi:putative DNA methylase
MHEPSASHIDTRFPFAGVSQACAGEKSVRHAHISTLQQWFARRPLAVCRAALFLALCPPPEDFGPGTARLCALERHAGVAGSVADKLDRFATTLSEWQSVTDHDLLGDARLILNEGRKPALIVDTFAGGGSISVEALRLGQETAASDLHPVACLALRAAIEFLPASPALVTEYERVSERCGQALDHQLRELYSADGETPLAFFWARTYRCPQCARDTVLVRDRSLARGRRAVAVDFGFDEDTFTLTSQVFVPTDASALKGTVDARGASCIHCATKVKTAWLQAEGIAGRIGEWLYATLRQRPDGSREYMAATDADRSRAARARPEWQLSRAVPATELDANGVRHTWAMQYGVRTIADLHSPRQAVALTRVLTTIDATQRELRAEGRPDAEVRALVLLLTLTFNRLIPYSTRQTWWQSSGEFPANMFSRQAIPMVWNYVEMPPCSPAAAGWSSATRWSTAVYEHLAQLPQMGRVERADAAAASHADRSVDVVAIDPPYFDSVGYSYLVEPFRAWTRELLAPLFPDDFAVDDVATEEAIVDRAHSAAPKPKSPEHFERKMTEALTEAHRVLRDDGVLILMYGHKEARAWEAILAALTKSGFLINASWPVRTERKVKFRHGVVNALAGSCLLICRKHAGITAEPVSWEVFLRLLEHQMAGDQRRMVAGGVDGPDLEAALLAPAMKLFAEHEVSHADGTRVSVADLFAEVPRVVAQMQLRIATESTALSGVHEFLAMPGVDAIALRELYFDRDHTDHPVLTLARSLADGLEGGTPADLLWASASAANRAAALALLRYIALSADQGDPDRQVIESALGRYAMPHMAEMPVG